MSDPTLKATVCPHCGAPAAPGESFCRNCGKQLFAPTMTAPPPVVPPRQAQPFPPTMPPPVKKGRSKLMMGCLIFISLIVVVAAAGGIYVWRKTIYTPPERKAPDIPQRAAGTMTEFPVDNDPTSPAKPTSIQTESLDNATAKAGGSSTTKLPPGIDKSKLSKGATTMTSAIYKPQPKTPSSSTTTTSTRDNIYICVLTAMPGQTDFGDDLATSVVQATSGTKTGVKVQSSKGATYLGTKIRSSQTNVYVLTKQGADIVILIFGEDPSTQTVIDRLAQNVGNGQGLIDYPEVKNSLWTLPASTPSDLTLVEVKTLSGDEIIGSSGSSGDFPSELRAFIPDRMTGSRYLDSSRQEWVALNLEYGSTFQAWRTWLLARGALGLSGAESTTVRDVDALYMNQDGKRMMIFQKGPYLILLSSPGGASVDRLVALGNQIQV
jgi:zinc ribbon protein